MGLMRKMGRRLLRAAVFGLVRPPKRSFLQRAVAAMTWVAPVLLSGKNEGKVREAERRPRETR